MQRRDLVEKANRGARALRSLYGATRLLCALALPLTLAGCWDDGPVPVEEPLELFIGSTEIGGGALTTDFDFGVPVPLVFNVEVGGFSIYSNTVPGFVPLGERDVSGAPFGLPTGTTIGMRITEIDPEVQIIWPNGLLAQAGDEVPIGDSPFDSHPTWQLSFAPGAELQPRFVSFVLTAPDGDFEDSEPYTMTLVVDETGDVEPFDPS